MDEMTVTGILQNVTTPKLLKEGINKKGQPYNLWGTALYVDGKWYGLSEFNNEKKLRERYELLNANLGKQVSFEVELNGEYENVKKNSTITIENQVAVTKTTQENTTRQQNKSATPEDKSTKKKTVELNKFYPTVIEEVQEETAKRLNTRTQSIARIAVAAYKKSFNKKLPKTDGEFAHLNTLVMDTSRNYNRIEQQVLTELAIKKLEEDQDAKTK